MVFRLVRVAGLGRFRRLRLKFLGRSWVFRWSLVRFEIVSV